MTIRSEQYQQYVYSVILHIQAPSSLSTAEARGTLVDAVWRKLQARVIENTRQWVSVSMGPPPDRVLIKFVMTTHGEGTTQSWSTAGYNCSPMSLMPFRSFWRFAHVRELRLSNGVCRTRGSIIPLNTTPLRGKSAAPCSSSPCYCEESEAVVDETGS